MSCLCESNSSQCVYSMSMRTVCAGGSEMLVYCKWFDCVSVLGPKYWYLGVVQVPGTSIWGLDSHTNIFCNIPFLGAQVCLFRRGKQRPHVLFSLHFSSSLFSVSPLHILCSLSLLCSLSHRMNVRCDKAVWRMWSGWILMLAHSYCCLKKKKSLPGNPSKWPSPHEHKLKERHLKNTSFFTAPVPQRCVFKSLMGLCDFSGQSRYFWKCFDIFHDTQVVFLLCCTCHVKRH